MTKPWHWITKLRLLMVCVRCVSYGAQTRNNIRTLVVDFGHFGGSEGVVTLHQNHKCQHY